MNFTAGIAMALFHREKTGEGQQILTSQSGATLHFQRPSMMGNFLSRRQRDDGKPLGEINLVQQVLRAKDGKWMICSMGRREMFDRFCNDVLKRPEIACSEDGKKYPFNQGASKDRLLHFTISVLWRCSMGSKSRGIYRWKT